jgi:hypothetical protein
VPLEQGLALGSQQHRRFETRRGARPDLPLPARPGPSESRPAAADRDCRRCIAFPAAFAGRCSAVSQGRSSTPTSPSRRTPARFTYLPNTTCRDAQACPGTAMPWLNHERWKRRPPIWIKPSVLGGRVLRARAAGGVGYESTRSAGHSPDRANRADRRPATLAWTRTEPASPSLRTSSVTGLCRLIPDTAIDVAVKIGRLVLDDLLAARRLRPFRQTVSRCKRLRPTSTAAPHQPPRSTPPATPQHPRRTRRDVQPFHYPAFVLARPGADRSTSPRKVGLAERRRRPGARLPAPDVETGDPPFVDRLTFCWVRYRRFSGSIPSLQFQSWRNRQQLADTCS